MSLNTLGIIKNGTKIKIPAVFVPEPHTPRDLTVAFAYEIANYSDEWAWIQARLNAHNTDDLRVGDYIPVTVSANTTDNIPAETHLMEIAGIDTYYQTADDGNIVKHHIDWISRDCYTATHQFNSSNNNNGNSSNSNPFLASNMKTWLDNTIYPLLPLKVRNVIKTKRALTPYRYQGGFTLSDDNSYNWGDFTKLWLPLECEIFNDTIWATKGYGNGQSVQYEIFSHNWAKRMKGAGPGNARTGWYTASASANSNTTFVHVARYGHSELSNATTSRCVPLCFRTMED